MTLDADLRGEGIRLAQAQPYLSDVARVQVRDGALEEVIGQMSVREIRGWTAATGPKAVWARQWRRDREKLVHEI